MSLFLNFKAILISQWISLLSLGKTISRISNVRFKYQTLREKMKSSTHRALISIIGRPNVGKSSIFNKLIKKRQNFVHNKPGITRDRIIGRFETSDYNFTLCDTGGFEKSDDIIKAKLREQALKAIEDAFLVLLVVDFKEGFNPFDKEIANLIRSQGKNFFVLVNKCDNKNDKDYIYEFQKIGCDHFIPLSAEHKLGFETLLEAINDFSQKNKLSKTLDQALGLDDDTIKVAIIGRPNVGKSSLLNRLVGEKRAIVDSKPGTTRDCVDIQITYHSHTFLFVDTAGVHKRSKAQDKIDAFCMTRSIQCIEESDLTVLVLDVSEGPTEGDARVAGYAFKQRKPILIVLNKWDLIEDKDSKAAQKVKDDIVKKLKYIHYSQILFTSALENKKVSSILSSSLELFRQSTLKQSTASVNKALESVLVKHTPPLLKNKSRRIKFYYATQVGTRPPYFVVFCSHPDDLHFSYKRYLENEFRKAFHYDNIPIKIDFRERSRSDSKYQK